MMRALRRAGVPLAFYYAVTLGLPVANGAAGATFWKHALVVTAVPVALVALFRAARLAVTAFRIDPNIPVSIRRNTS